MRMNNNKKQNLLIFALVIIIVLLSGILIYILVTNKKGSDSKNNNSSSTTTTNKKESNKETRKLITTDSAGNEYYAVFIDPEDDYQTLKIVSTKDKKNYQDILDLSMTLMSGYDNVPYNGYKVEDNALFYINNDCDSKEFNQGDEIKVTLKDNKYTLTKTGKTYKGNAGIKC